MAQDYQDVWIKSEDGLNLYARDYPADGEDAPVVLCLHGLTRNSKDFEPVVEYLKRDYRLLIPDQRGRGKSDYDPEPMRYNPFTYMQDMFCLLDELSISKVMCLGTSMGGIMSMMMAAARPNLITKIILNDIGTEFDPKGIERISNYVGIRPEIFSWNDAVKQTRSINEVAFPHLTDEQWLIFTKRLYVCDDGKFSLLHDANISIPIKNPPKTEDGDALSPDLWKVFEYILHIPVLVLRGEISDLLSTDCVAKMKQRHSNLKHQEISGVGHAPQLSEPEAKTAITKFLRG